MLADAFETACRLAKDDEYLDAIKAYEKILEKYPDHIPSHYNLGQLAAKLGDVEKAHRHFTRVTELEPDFAQGHFQLAQVLLVEQQAQAAIDQLIIAVNLVPEYIDAQHLLACSAMQQQQELLAQTHFEQLLRMAPDHAAAHLNFALLKLHQTKVNEAKVLLEQALKLDPTLIEAHYHRGVIAMQQGEIELAILEMQETLDRQSDHFAANYNLAILYKMQHHYKLAIFYLKKAQSLQPDNESVAFLLAAFEKQLPDKAPESFVAELFNHYAHTYDEHMEKVLQYQTPQQMRELLTPFQPLLPKNPNILDLGCGTGLIAHYFQDMRAQFIGVDLSKEMLTQAKKRDIYSELYECDIETFLQNNQNKYDLIIASEVFNYFGPLENLIAACKNALHPQGLLLFSIELSDESNYHLHTFARYAHRQSYMDAITANDWYLLASEAIVLRSQENIPVKGQIFLFQKC
jgi:predicted TPR repeat methyltransferase